jgi:protein required for attachment to host cells
MKQLIVVADGSRARLFGVERKRLVEREDVVCPEHKTMDRDLYSETKTGRWDRPFGTHSFDDHRSAHDREVERRFAHTVLERCEHAVAEDACGELVVVAAPRILGTLRPYFVALEKKGIHIVEVERNLAQWTRDQIQDALAADALLGPRPRATRA